MSKVKSGSAQSDDANAAGISGIQSRSRVKKPISERQKVQIQHFEERRNKLMDEFDDFQEAKDSLDVMYKSMIREGEKLKEVRSNLVRMLFEEDGDGPVPEDLFPNYSPTDPGDSDEAGSEDDEPCEEPDVVVSDRTDYEPKIQEEQDKVSIIDVTDYEPKF